MGYVLIRENGEAAEFGFFLICSGYLVEDGRVLLVHHNRFNKWVPPGGHVAAGETFADTAVRECLEETGIRTQAISAQPEIHPADDNATPTAAPFYVDVEREGFAVPAIVQFFFLRRVNQSDKLVAQLEEVFAVKWFNLTELDSVETFEQVRSLARYALIHHPDVRKR